MAPGRGCIYHARSRQGAIEEGTVIDADSAILTLYALIMPVWVALSVWVGRRSSAWAFTPRWHRVLVPAFRLFFLVTLPLENLLAERRFMLPVFAIGAVATVGWLGWRWWYLARAPRSLPREDSVRYNTGYIANLVAFALACHSFVCVVVMINVSLPMLLVRERYARRATAGIEAAA